MKKILFCVSLILTVCGLRAQSAFLGFQSAHHEKFWVYIDNHEQNKNSVEAIHLSGLRSDVRYSIQIVIDNKRRHTFTNSLVLHAGTNNYIVDCNARTGEVSLVPTKQTIYASVSHPVVGLPQPNQPGHPADHHGQPNQPGHPGDNHGQPNHPGHPGDNHGQPNHPGHPGDNHGQPNQPGHPADHHGQPNQPGHPADHHGQPNQPGHPADHHGQPNQPGHPADHHGQPNQPGHPADHHGQPNQPGHHHGEVRHSSRHENHLERDSRVEVVVVNPTPQPTPPPPPAYCSEPDFLAAKNLIASKTFESDKLALAKQVVAGEVMTAAQLTEIARLFEFETDKLEFLKFAYNYCYDKNKYYLVNSVFTFSSSIDELNRYIQGR